MKILNTRLQSGLPEGRDFVIKELEFCRINHRPFKMPGGAILLCLDGEAEIAIDGRCHKVCKGCEVLLLDGCTLFIKRCNENFRIRIFIYSKDIAYQAMHKFEPSFFMYVMAEPVYQHTEGRQDSIEAYMRILSDLQNDVHNEFANLIVTNLLRCIMLNVYDKLKRIGDLESSKAHTRKEYIYSNFMSLLTENVRRHRDVAFYADKLCISPRYLSGITKEIANETPKQTIDGFLISEIKLMLTFSDMSIQQIADYLRFPDQSYLGRYFKRFAGMSPQSYRKKEMVM